MRSILAACGFAVLAGSAAAQEATPADAAQALERKWQEIKDSATEERTVSFERIQPGRANGGTYPFRVTATVRDYDAGYPPNGYYGTTCTMKFTNETFQLRQDAFGDWQAQGRMNVFDDNRCENNPAEGASSIPLESVPGQPASAFGRASGMQPAPAPNRLVSTGDWACFGTGGAMLFTFALQGNGTYLDGDGNRAGSFAYDTASATIRFSGGALGGQRGSDMDGHSFSIGSNVNCEASG